MTSPIQPIPFAKWLAQQGLRECHMCRGGRAAWTVVRRCRECNDHAVVYVDPADDRDVEQSIGELRDAYDAEIRNLPDRWKRWTGDRMPEVGE